MNIEETREAINKLLEPVWGMPVREVNDRLRTAANMLGQLVSELEQAKQPKLETTGERFGVQLNTYRDQESAMAFVNGLTNTTRKGFKVLSAGVTGNNGTPLMWAIVSRPEAPEEAKQTI